MQQSAFGQKPLSRNDFNYVMRSSVAVRGRHRVETDGVDRTTMAATVAVAAGALLATSYQAGTAHAAPVVEPAPAPAPAPGLPDLGVVQKQVEQQVQQWQKDFESAVFGARTQTVKPVNGIVTSGYGSRWGSMHFGVDIANQIGTPIQSVANGTVIEAGPAAGFGLWVRVRHDDGTTAVYGHVNDLLSHAGQRVNAGQTIATVGNRGNSTGPHLHLEIWQPNGAKIDPVRWLAAHGVHLGPEAH